MAQQQALAALEAVLADVGGERLVALEHFAGDGLGPDILLLDPRMRRGESVELVVEKLAQRLGMLDFLQLGHALLVANARGFPFLDLQALLLVHLSAQDLLGILHDRLAKRQHVERVVGTLIPDGGRFGWRSGFIPRQRRLIAA